MIEAIDFLLTGSIQDLSGEGTGDISLQEHGPYLRTDVDDAWVNGTFTDGDESVTIKRRLSDRNSLECDGDIPASIENLMESAKKGQHYLSRREILNFIVARKQSRSEQLRTLLDLEFLPFLSPPHIFHSVFVLRYDWDSDDVKWFFPLYLVSNVGGGFFKCYRVSPCFQ